MKFNQFRNAILAPFTDLQKESGEEFLELMVDTIVCQDENGNKLDVLYGWEFNLSRSRHWDKEEEIYIMYDGFTDEHLGDVFDILIDMDVPPASIVLTIEGMNDLEEPIHKQIKVELAQLND